MRPWRVPRRSVRPRRTSVLVLVVGLAVVGLYYVLRAMEVGKIGAPTDIGGGLIALVGYITVAVGLVMILVDIRRSPPGDRDATYI